MNAGKIAFWTIAGLVVAGGAYWAYTSLQPKKAGSAQDGPVQMTKKQALEYLSLVKNWNDARLKFYEKTDADYLVAWAQAIKSGSGSFSVNGRNYSSQTGMAL